MKMRLKSADSEFGSVYVEKMAVSSAKVCWDVGGDRISAVRLYLSTVCMEYKRRARTLSCGTPAQFVYNKLVIEMCLEPSENICQISMVLLWHNKYWKKGVLSFQKVTFLPNSDERKRNDQDYAGTKLLKLQRIGNGIYKAMNLLECRLEAAKA